tara:strand:+ start:822 stop:1124 length:303 start_codon:yes stop_codon:yes gene_type:complete
MKFKEILLVPTFIGVAAVLAIYIVGEKILVCTSETTIVNIESVEHRTSTVSLADGTIEVFNQGKVNIGDRVCKIHDVYQKFPWSEGKTLKQSNVKGSYRL